MDRGVYYWMISWGEDPELSRVYLGESHEQEVTCVTLRRRMFVCGTQSGKIYTPATTEFLCIKIQYMYTGTPP